MFTTISYALSILLTTAALVLIIKKLIIEFNDRYTGLTILIILTLAVISIFSSAIGGFGAIKLDLMPLTSSEIALIKKHNIISFIIGYASIAFSYLILNTIKSKNKNEQSSNVKHWDLEKFK